MRKLRNLRVGGETVPYAVAFEDEDELREALGARGPVALPWTLDLLEAAGWFLPDRDRDRRWVTHRGRKFRAWVFAAPDQIALRRVANAARYDARERGEEPPRGVRVTAWV